MDSPREQKNNISTTTKVETKLEQMCRQYNIPLSEEDQIKLTMLDKVAFCFTHGLRTYKDFCRVFGGGDGNSIEGCHVQHVYSYGLIDEPYYWFRKLSKNDIKTLEEQFPGNFNQEFYRGKHFYLEWLLDNHMYEDALVEIKKYGWSIISENALCYFVKQTNNTNQIHFKFPRV